MKQHSSQDQLPNVVLVLAAHGSPVDKTVNERIRDTATRIQRDGPWQQVIPAFYHGAPGFEESVALIPSSSFAVVVPLMTSEGHFTDVIIQAFDSAFRQQSEVSGAVSAPIGTHTDVPHIVGQRIQTLLSSFRWSAADTGILLVGHGTRKHPRSRVATLELAERIGNLYADSLTEPSVAFIDDDPTIDEAFLQINQPRLVVIPFLISDGPHARIDIPQALELKPVSNSNESLLGRAQGVDILIDRPFGVLPQVDRLINARANEVLQAHQPGRTNTTSKEGFKGGQS